MIRTYGRNPDYLRSEVSRAVEAMECPAWKRNQEGGLATAVLHFKAGIVGKNAGSIKELELENHQGPCPVQHLALHPYLAQV